MDKKQAAKILRAYAIYRYINFEERSGAHIGTVEWSENVIDFLTERWPELI